MTQKLDLTPGNETWHKWRKLATETVPGKHSALYFMASKVLQKENLVPMTPRVHLPMCLFAEGATGIPEIDNARIKLILIFRGGGKTTCVTKAKPILNIARNKNYATGIANETTGMAETFLGDIKSELENNVILQTLFPEIVPDFNQTIWKQDRIITARDKLNPTNPSVLAAGVGKTVTGVHLNEWIVDDALSQDAAENAYRGSFTEIEATNRWITRLQPLLNNPKRDPILFIGCIAEGQHVLMADGTWKEIQDVEIGDEVWARKKDGSEDFAAREVTGVWPQGYSDVVEINVAGRKIVSTEDHPFLGREKYWPTSPPKWKEAKEFARENGQETRGVLMECFEGMKTEGTECDYDFMWLAGFMWGDGWITKYERPDGSENYCVNFAKGVHEAQNKRAERLLNERFGDLGGKCYHTGTGTRTVRMDNNEAGRRWERWGLAPGVRAPEKTIPEWVFKASWRCKRAFLHGLCSADGHKTAPRRWKLGTSGKEMAEQVRRLALTCNVRPTLIYDHSGVRQAPNSPKPKWSQFYVLSLNFLKGFHETKCYGVKEVKKLQVQQPVYDLTIEDGNCTFIVNGAECQNTRWWEGDSYEFIEDFWGHGEERRTFIWKVRLPHYKHEFDDGRGAKIYEYPPDTVHFELHRRGEVAIFRMPARDDAGRPVFPERLDEEELELLQSEDPVFFAGQYLLEPTAGAASEFNVDWLKYYENEGPHQIRFKDDLGKPVFLRRRDLTTYISVDPAFSDKNTSARTAIPVLGTDGSRLFLLEDFAERGMSEDDIAQQVLAFELEYRPQKIFVETIVAQVAVANAIRRIYRDRGMPEPQIEEIPSHGKQKKDMRIYGLQSYFKRGILHIHKSHSRFLHEYAAFPRGALRDLLDAISFQKDEWERVFRMGDRGHRLTPEARRQTERIAIDRIKSHFNKRRGRR